MLFFLFMYHHVHKNKIYGNLNKFDLYHQSLWYIKTVSYSSELFCHGTYIFLAYKHLKSKLETFAFESSVPCIRLVPKLVKRSE